MEDVLLVLNKQTTVGSQYFISYLIYPNSITVKGISPCISRATESYLNSAFNTLDISKLSQINALLIESSALTWSAQDLAPLFEGKNLLELMCVQLQPSALVLPILRFMLRFLAVYLGYLTLFQLECFLGVQLIETSCRDVFA